MKKLKKKMKNKKKKIIIGLTCGVYDLFHYGHVRMLQSAKALCDKLIVGLSSDELVKKYKNFLFFWVFLLCLPTHPCTHYLPYPVETCTPL